MHTILTQNGIIVTMSRKKTDKLRLNLNRFIYYMKNKFFSAQNIVLVGAIALCLIWTINSIKSITRNWQLTERLSTEQTELELLKVEVETMELENEYYKTEEYQELSARKNLNKKLPGENMVYLPENSESAKNKHKTVKAADKVKEYSNPEKWMKLLFPTV